MRSRPSRTPAPLRSKSRRPHRALPRPATSKRPGGLGTATFSGRPLRLRVGEAGETAAVALLEGAGLRILARDWRCRLGQLDIVATDGDCLVAVEVKARRGTGYGLPQEAVDARKQHKLRQLVAAYRASGPWAGRPCRIDVVALLLDAELRVREGQHIVNAVSG